MLACILEEYKWMQFNMKCCILAGTSQYGGSKRVYISGCLDVSIPTPFVSSRHLWPIAVRAINKRYINTADQLASATALALGLANGQAP